MLQIVGRHSFFIFIYSLLIQGEQMDKPDHVIKSYGGEAEVMDYEYNLMSVPLVV